jgi:alpha/beta hydrolase fold
LPTNIPLVGAASRLVVGLAAVGIVVSCSASVSPPASAITSASASALTASPTVDPLSDPSIEGRFAVTDDGRELALICWGEGSPTVLLETGGPNIQGWTGSGVVRELAAITRVCTYDRAGTGDSDPPPYERRDADDVITDLRALLIAADVDGPYVLLGRSFGGMIVTYYAAKLPKHVIGVVVLDTPAPSAEFTEESEPELVWDYEGNTERLDVVNGFENRFANHPPHFEVPLLLITPVPGEGSAENESFWLQVSPSARQVQLECTSPTAGPCTTEVVEFVTDLGLSG